MMARSTGTDNTSDIILRVYSKKKVQIFMDLTVCLVRECVSECDRTWLSGFPLDSSTVDLPPTAAP